MSKFLGILYHDDTETPQDNYIAFSCGETKEEAIANLKLIDTPKYTEEMKTFEFGMDADFSLDEKLRSEELGYYYSKTHFWCEDELDSLLKLSFKQSIDFAIKKQAN